MGKRLREELAIPETWTSQEIRSYESDRRRQLTSIYLIKNIPATQPANRVRYLDKLLKIENNSRMEVHILETEKNRGKAMALIALEEMALNKF